MTEIERIQFIIDSYEDGNAASFAKRIGTSPSSVSKLRKGVFNIGAFAEKIARAYPNLNCRWLLTGEGQPAAPEPPRDAIEKRLAMMIRPNNTQNSNTNSNSNPFGIVLKKVPK